MVVSTARPRQGRPPFLGGVHSRVLESRGFECILCACLPSSCLVRVCVPVWEHGTRDRDELCAVASPGQADHSLHFDQAPSVESVMGVVGVSV